MIVDDSWARASVWPPTIMHYHALSCTIMHYHALSCTIIDYHQLSFSLSLFKFFMLVDDSFSSLSTRMMIVHDSFSVSCFGNHWPDSSQKTCCRPLSSRKIHTSTSLSYGRSFIIHIFTRKELGSRCSRDFACATASELSSTIMNFFGPAEQF